MRPKENYGRSIYEEEFDMKVDKLRSYVIMEDNIKKEV